MPIPATWLDETSVSTTSLPFGVDLGTRAVQLAGGNTLVIWQSSVDTGAGAPFGSDIIGRILSPTGEPLTGEFRVNASHSSANEGHADIAALPGGGFAVVYEDHVGSTQSLYLDSFDANGTLIPSASTVVESFSYVGPAFDAQITPLSSGSVLVAYNNHRGAQAIAARTYDFGTGTLSAPVALSPGVPIDAVTLANGNTVVLRYSGASSSAQMAFDLVSPLGAVIMSSTLGLAPPDAALVGLAGGGFAIAFTGTSYTRQGLSIVVSRYDNGVRTYDAQGNFLAYGDFFVSTSGNQAETPTLAALPNGNFEMVYRDGQGHLHAIDFSPGAIQLGEFDFATRPLLAAIDRIDPVAVGLADGRFAAIWTVGNATTESVHVEILDTQSTPDAAPFYTPPGQFGTPGDDLISLAVGSTYVAAGAGNDTLIDGATASRLVGGAGDDVYVIANAGDAIVELAGGGHDTVQTGLAHIDIPANVEDAVYTGSGATIIGGNALDNRITGGPGADVLVGYDGDDTLVGGAGAANELIGGNGNDIYVSNAAGDTIVEYAGGGVDRIETALPIYVLRNQVENLSYIGADGFLGIGNELDNVITGGTGRDDLYGRDGNDVITGGPGAANTLLGNLGDDVFIVAAVGDSVVEYAGEGTDRVVTALSSFLLPANVENLLYSGGGSFIGFGNDLANSITGGAGADSLYGYGGNDRLIGAAGAADTLIGGTGDDVYVIGDNTGSSIIELLGEGVDTIETTASAYSINADNVEILRFVGIGNFSGTGNGLDNVLYGGAGNDTLSGWGGSDLIFGGAGDDNIFGGSGAPDTLLGGTGDDFYVIEAAGTSVIESVGEGNDEVRTTTSSYNMPENVETLRYIGGGNFTSAGSNGNDVIFGGGGVDSLSGGFGNDVLIGAAGSDILSGGAGADQFRYNGGEIGIDQILDFTPGTDRITLANPSVENAGFNHTTNITVVQGPGAAAATSADSTFIYDSLTGLLSYDADGSRVGGVMALAYLASGLTLSASDFIFA